MVSVSEATFIIADHLFSSKAENVTVSNALGRVLAEPIFADRDFPPFDRVAMDGIAIQLNQLNQGQVKFKIEGIAAAGTAQIILHDKEKCIEVMTGAPLPKHTDTVIRYEDIEIKDKSATVLVAEIPLKQNIHPQAQDAKQSQVLLTAGTLISPAEIALIASVGKATIEVKSYPRTAIISTGDELVDIKDSPAPHQIRRSNSYALQAALQSLGCEATLYHISDNKDIITKELEGILDQNDLIIISGGVSKGKFDFVPVVLEKLGVKKHFHTVKQRPGKPFWFGGLSDKFIFALPGNPVSTYMCFYRYIKPWLLKSWGLDIQTEFAFLGSDFQFDGALTYFLQANIVNEAGMRVGYPLPGGGSGDFANLKEVNAFMELPEEKNTFKKGEVYPIHFFRSQ